MRILIDTNIFIAAETYGEGDEVSSPLAAELLSLAGALGYQIVVSHATREDLVKGKLDLRRKREAQLAKYHVLEPIPVDLGLATVAGFPIPLSLNDSRDLRLLNDLRMGAANVLVTEDAKLRARAVDAGVGSNVLSLSDAVEMLGSLSARSPRVRTVNLVRAYEIDTRQELFDSIRISYPEFDHWFSTVVSEERPAIILGSPEKTEGVAILKAERDCPWDLLGNVLKISTFKIADAYDGSGRGELLLRSVIEFARSNGHEISYVEVLPEQRDLIHFLGDFGFHGLPHRSTPRGEVILVKRLRPEQGVAPPTDPLVFAQAFGPGQQLIKNAHIVPVKPLFHARLFPDTEKQLELLPRSEPYGNAIRKAYLSHSATRQIMPGDCLLFVRTGGSPSIVTVSGVAEDVKVSSDADTVVRFVGNRTVYSQKQILSMCGEREVLAIRFRFDRALNPVWTMSELQDAGVVSGPVQSVQRIIPERLPWIRARLEESR